MSQIEPAFFKPFIEGTVNVFRVQFKTDVSPEEVFFKGTKSQPEFDIAGAIGITSGKFAGNITLYFQERVYLKMMERLLGESLEKITNELQDGVAEMLNMIYGHAKIILNDQGHSIQKAFPKVITGKQLKSSNFNNSKVIVLSFVADIGLFQIEICSD